jgi:hypothetical protein
LRKKSPKTPVTTTIEQMRSSEKQLTVAIRQPWNYLSGEKREQHGKRKRRKHV